MEQILKIYEEEDQKIKELRDEWSAAFDENSDLDNDEEEEQKQETVAWIVLLF